MTVPWDQDTFDRYAAMLEEVFDLWRAGRRDDATALGEEWYRDVPDFEGFPERQSSLQLAEVVAEAGDLDAARVWLGRAREAYGGDRASDGARSMLGFVEGIICFLEGDADRAFAFFKASHDFLGQRAFDLPRHQRYWEFFAERAGIRGTTPRKKARTKDLEKLAEEGDQLHAAGNAEGAVEVWQGAIDQLGPEPEDHPMAMWFYASIGDALVELGRHDEADRALASALRAGGTDNGFVWLRKGQALVELGDVDAGVEALTSAYMLEDEEIFSDEDPKYAQLLVDRGVIRR